ncbi:hypothetical protein BN8_00508 [Fibrisoma limi BUZ 3]|uniref:DUF6371 domain-containing protein n=1 Tax=Fibrisoma limi BUZ 3 TaxID=1185876 RepID=I2GCF5_9BACT|nr:DUF6371 domain-containing protein [Fibrisoma limi]CCH51579.1 hypothetical protein BN8_00508 [Fibrisoma limi BUZ 3]
MAYNEIDESAENITMMPRWLSKPPSLIDPEVVKRSLVDYKNNNLFHYLSQTFNVQVATNLAQAYVVGTTDHWPGANTLWRKNQNGHVQFGELVLFDSATGRRRKELEHTPIQVHSHLKLASFNAVPCFFGEHLLKNRPTNIVAVVEREETAMIASIFKPDWVWIAVGDTNMFERYNLQVLSNRKVVVFSTLSDHDHKRKFWEKLHMSLSLISGCQVTVSTYLQDKSTNERRVAEFDIADVLVRYRDKGTGIIPDDLNEDAVLG